MKNVCFLLVLLLSSACTRNSVSEKSGAISKDTFSSAGTSAQVTGTLAASAKNTPVDMALLKQIINAVVPISVPVKIETETDHPNGDKRVLLSPEEISMLLGNVNKENKNHIVYATHHISLKDGTGIIYHLHYYPEDEDEEFMGTTDEMLLVLYDKNGVKKDAVLVALQEYDASEYSVINSGYTLVRIGYYEMENIAILQTRYVINGLEIENKGEERKEFTGDQKGYDEAREFLRKFENSMGL